MINQINFYQSVMIPEDKLRGRNSFNTINQEMIKDVLVSREGETIKLFHKDWKHDYFVGMANVRYYSVEKSGEIDEPEKPEIKKQQLILKKKADSISSENTQKKKKKASKKAKKKTKKKVSKK